MIKYTILFLVQDNKNISPQDIDQIYLHFTYMYDYLNQEITSEQCSIISSGLRQRFLSLNELYISLAILQVVYRTLTINWILQYGVLHWLVFLLRNYLLDQMFWLLSLVS